MSNARCRGRDAQSRGAKTIDQETGDQETGGQETGDQDSIELDPQARRLLAALALAKRIPYSELAPAQARAQYLELCRRTRPARPWDGTASDQAIPGPAGPLPTRLYRPAASGSGPLPALLFFHGGGFCIGDLDTHDAVCRQLASEAGCAVLAVDYRLAPEHPFPAAIEDCLAAVGFAARHGADLGLDPARLAVGGDSAGGNLAAVAALLARDAGLALRCQLLIYPGADMASQRPSRRAFADGYLLTAESIAWFEGNYMHGHPREDWRASPLRASDLAGLPPALILVGECDPLRDDCRAYADRLAASGSPAAFILFPGMIHGFITMGGLIDAADRAIARSAEFLREHLAS